MKSKFWILVQYNQIEFMSFLQRNPDPKQIIPQILMTNKYLQQVASAYHRAMLVYFVKDFSEAEKNRCMAKAFEAGYSSKDTVYQFVEAEWSSTFPHEVKIITPSMTEIENQ